MTRRIIGVLSAQNAGSAARGSRETMVDATAQNVGVEQVTDGTRPDEAVTQAQAGSDTFPELVRAHYVWERAGCVDGPEAERYRTALQAFQAKEGNLMHVYWATRRPSAIALTLKPSGRFARWFSDHDESIRLHRVTDWLARESQIAELLHHCDTLAIKVSEVLRGSPERIAMQWIYAVQSHLVGFIERTGGRADKKALKAVWESQKDELIEIERYYTRAATKAARIVYFWGMVVGAAVSVALGGGLALLLWYYERFDEPKTLATQTFLLCFVMGTLGAFVSVLMRMSSNSFRVDYEVGRSTIRRLGSFRPFIGAIFGVAMFFLIKSGLLNIVVDKDPPSDQFFFFGSLAFLAGFNERWTNVILGKAEQTIAGSLGDSSSDRRRHRDEDEDED
ncbi:MAG TPA: hypothetical protein VFB87_11550 [Gaiellaceae bacterium]|nr:hypothetical protein [Gaiellaceae bacterium]